MTILTRARGQLRQVFYRFPQLGIPKYDASQLFLYLNNKVKEVLGELLIIITEVLI